MNLTQTWYGALIAAVLLDIFLGLIGFAILVILFFYYFGLILILGAQINAYFVERHQPSPVKH